MIEPTRARAIAGIAAALSAVPTVVRSQTTEPIRFSAVPTDDMTPIYYAVKNGLYQKAGIALEIVTVSSGSASTAAVVAGTYELGKASPVASILAHAKGFPVAIVANGAVYSKRAAYSRVVVAADSPIKTAADCNGKTGAAAGLNDINQLLTMNWVDKNGGDAKTMKWVEVPASVTAAALEEHRIDLAVLNEPLLSAALQSGKVRVLVDAFAALADRWLSSAYLARPEWADKHAEIVRKFARVTYEACAYANEHKSETIALMSEVTKIPVGVFAKMTRIEGATTTDPSLLQPVIDLAVRYKALPASFPSKTAYWT
jgi:NitT/TauT family transport system substrate-binding protein